MTAVEPEVESLLEAFPELKLQTGRGTVMCSLTRHEMPGRAEVVRAYVEGRKFQTLKAEKDFDFKRLRPYIVPSRKRKRQRQLFCGLTNRYLNRKPAEVELHLKGKRYKCALENYNAGRLSLFEERLGKRERERGGDGAEVEMEEEEIEDGDRGEEGEGEVENQQLETVSAKKSTRVDGGRKRKAVAATASSSAKRRLCSSQPQKRET